MKSVYLLVSFTLLMSLVACRAKEPYVWVENLPTVEESIPPYMIQTGDQIELSVWNQTQISGRYTVRNDGIITVPLIGEVPIAGISPAAAAEIIREKLEGDIVQDVRVVVIAREINPHYVSVVGEVNEPGQFELKPEDTIVDLLARASGLTDFADKKSIFVLRKSATVPRIRFNYERLITTKNGGILFKLQHGDVIVVE